MFSQTWSGGGCTAENLMILSVNGQDLSAPKITRGDSVYCFARVLSLENRGLMDVLLLPALQNSFCSRLFAGG